MVCASTYIGLSVGLQRNTKIGGTQTDIETGNGIVVVGFVHVIQDTQLGLRHPDDPTLLIDPLARRGQVLGYSN